jgi:hypothetical protein
VELAALRTAALLGASSGLRTLSGPAALALHGRLGRGLPLLGVAPPVWRQKPGQTAADAGFHLVYGFAAAAALAVLRRTPD